MSPNDDNASLGYWIRRRRKALDLTQARLAQQVGCAVATIKKIEADERRPSRQMAERLADCLSLPLEERAAFLRVANAELSLHRQARCAACRCACPPAAGCVRSTRAGRAPCLQSAGIIQSPGGPQAGSCRDPRAVAAHGRMPGYVDRARRHRQDTAGAASCPGVRNLRSRRVLVCRSGPRAGSDIGHAYDCPSPRRQYGRRPIDAREPQTLPPPAAGALAARQL